MPVAPTYPGIYIEEVPSLARTITPAPTSVAVFIGYAHPFLGECARNNQWGHPLEVFNFGEFERKFGGIFTSDRVDPNLGHAVNAFFRNGGSRAYVVGLRPRYTDTNNPNTIRDITPESDVIDGARYTAKRLTSDANPVTVQQWNARDEDGVRYADLLVSFERHIETYRRVQNSDPTKPDSFVDIRLAGSTLVSVAPEPGGYTAFTSGERKIQLGTMAGPGFSYTTLNVQDFLNVFKANAPLDKLPVFNLLATPGVSAQLVVDQAISFCERKHAFFIMDPPQRHSADGFGGTLDLIQDYIKQAHVPKLSNVAVYFPWLASRNPLTDEEIEIPPSGAAAGIFARTDRTRGVWKAPAGLEAGVRNTSGVVERGKMTDMKQGTLNHDGINVIRAFPGLEPVVWGARTLGSVNPAYEQWKYVPVRRMALFLEQSLLRSLGWAVFEPNAEPLWSAIRLSVESFMMMLYRQGAFFGTTTSEAFRVRCGRDTTTDTDINLGIVNIEVGFRPLKPAEFVIIKIAQLAGQTS